LKSYLLIGKLFSHSKTDFEQQSKTKENNQSSALWLVSGIKYIQYSIVSVLGT
jgi:hypothetical protein